MTAETWVVICPDGSPWGNKSFDSQQFACAAICHEKCQYWPTLLRRGYQIKSATLTWGDA
jgi:hypothetical protein